MYTRDNQAKHGHCERTRAASFTSTRSSAAVAGCSGRLLVFRVLCNGWCTGHQRCPHASPAIMPTDNTQGSGAQAVVKIADSIASVPPSH